MCTLGVKYFNGDGVERDRIKAFRLFDRAANKDNNTARQWLGHCYEHGYGCPGSYSMALKWYHIGANRLHKGCTEARDALIDRLKKIADNDPEAAEGLATAFAQGWCDVNQKSDYLAFRYWRIAAEGGRSESKTNLGEFYYCGKGTDTDYGEALRWFRSAAADGEATAMYCLGLMYVNGEGTAPDPAEGARWYTRAAGLGNRYAMNNLGVLYMQGNGVERDLLKAIDCYEKAKAAGNNVAGENLTALVQRLMSRQSDHHERAVAGYMFVAAKETKKGLKMLEKASQNEPKAFGYLASLWYTGIFMEPDYNKCVHYARQGAERGDIMSHLIMGTLYYHGKGVPVEYRKAAEHWSAAAAGGDVESIYNLSVLYCEGTGVDKNPAKALELLNDAIDRGSIQALVSLAALSYNGDGIPRDYPLAFKLMQRCIHLRASISKEEYSEIARNLSACYRFGRGTEPNEELADYWMEISALTGNTDAAGVRSMFGISTKIL